MSTQISGTTGVSTVQPTSVVQASLGANVAGNGPCFSAYQSTLQSLNAFTKVQLQTKEFDTSTAFDAVNNFRFQPAVAGYYQVSGCVAVASAIANLGLLIYKNGARFKDIGSSVSATAVEACGSCLVYLNGSTDYVELWAYSASAVNTAPNTYSPYFQGYLARSA